MWIQRREYHVKENWSKIIAISLVFDHGSGWCCCLQSWNRRWRRRRRRMQCVCKQKLAAETNKKNDKIKNKRKRNNAVIVAAARKYKHEFSFRYVRSTKFATKKKNKAAAAYVKKTSEEKEEEWNLVSQLRMFARYFLGSLSLVLKFHLSASFLAIKLGRFRSISLSRVCSSAHLLITRRKRYFVHRS